MSGSGSYHHGDLRRAVLAAAVEAIAHDGPQGLSLRDLARRAGVSHAAPAHHFGDRTGLLTAVAVQGYGILADALQRAAQDGDLLDVGVAYVRFAVDHPGHFAVLHRPDLYAADDEDLVQARERAAAVLGSEVTALSPGQVGGDAEVAAVAAWSLVHGFATLWLDGALHPGMGSDPDAAARRVAGLLFPRG